MDIKVFDVVMAYTDRKVREDRKEKFNVFCFRADRVVDNLGVSAIYAEEIPEKDGVVVEFKIDDLEISGRLRSLFELLVLSSDSVGFRYEDEDEFIVSFYKFDIFEE